MRDLLALTVTRCDRAGQFSLPGHGVIAPSGVGVEPGRALAAVLALGEDGESLRPPIVERGAADLGGRPRPVVTGPGGSTFRARNRRRSARRFSCSSRRTF